MSVTEAKVIEVSSDTFAQEVVARSREVPVIVDFWAPWCGPCRVLGPILEKLAREANGTFRLVKVNVDENPDLAARYGVQGIPAVKAFRDGRVVSEFVGALPEAVVRNWLSRVVPPRVDKRLEQAQARALAGALDEAEALYRQVLADEPNNTTALIGLADLLAVRNRPEEAGQLLDRLPADAALSPAVRQLRNLLSFQLEARDLEEEHISRLRLAGAPDNLEARWALATRLAAQRHYREALEHYLEIARRDRKYRDDGARKAMLAIFEILGPDSPLTKEYQARLANVLY
ncbi:MAG: thioredoxin [Chloroflexota bacterium]